MKQPVPLLHALLQAALLQGHCARIGSHRCSPVNRFGYPAGSATNRGYQGGYLAARHLTRSFIGLVFATSHYRDLTVRPRPNLTLRGQSSRNHTPSTLVRSYCDFGAPAVHSLGYFVGRGIPFLEPPKTPFSVLTMLLTSATYPPRNGFKPWIPGWIQRGLG